MPILPRLLQLFGKGSFKIPISTFTMQHKNISAIHKVDKENTLNIAANCLRDGAVIALPTDTVYGLACDANNEQSIQKLYNIKGRDFHKPISICVRNLSDLRKYGQAEHLGDALLAKLLPGPITIIIERSKYLSNPFLNPTTSKIGIRIPNCKFIQELCSIYHEQPLALTSANKSSEPSSLNINEFKCLWPLLGGIFDAGAIGLTEDRRSASTVVDLALPGQYNIVRKGVALNYTLDILHHHGLKPIGST